MPPLSIKINLERMSPVTLGKLVVVKLYQSKINVSGMIDLIAI